MSQVSLILATRANQALLLPVLLVATSINESRPEPVIQITYEDVAELQQGDKAVVQLTGASGTTVYGTVNALQELQSSFPYLKSKDEQLVRRTLYPPSPSKRGRERKR